MGKGTVLKCPKCNSEYDLFLGNGMRSFCEEQLFNFSNDSDENIIVRSKENEIDNLLELQNFLKLKNIKINQNFGNDYYYCDKCKCFEVRFYYYLKSSGKIFSPKYRCKRCNSKLNHTHKKNMVYNHYCSKCNIPMKETGLYIYWD